MGGGLAYELPALPAQRPAGRAPVLLLRQAPGGLRSPAAPPPPPPARHRYRLEGPTQQKPPLRCRCRRRHPHRLVRHSGRRGADAGPRQRQPGRARPPVLHPQRRVRALERAALPQNQQVGTAVIPERIQQGGTAAPPPHRRAENRGLPGHHPADRRATASHPTPDSGYPAP